MKQYDVIVIGGGLAGLSLAIQLANDNRSVLVLEKNKYPFHRVCGEYVSMESWNFLERIGMPLSEMNLPRITKLKVSSVKGKVIEHKLDLGGFGISRYKFDSTLAGIAKIKGAEIKEECRAEGINAEGEIFTTETNSGAFSSSVVIGAFGKRSNLDKKLNRSFEQKQESANWVGVKYHIKADVPENQIELHNFSNGYCGISKVEDEKYCLCYLTRSENLRRSNGSIRQLETEVLSQNPFLKNYFADREKFLFAEPITISQITFQNKLPVERNMLMLGDASGMIAPLCGNGMSIAMHASAITFPIIQRFFDRKISRADMENEYTRQWRKRFASRLNFGRFIQPLLVKPSLSNPAIATLKHFPFLMNSIVRATHGKPF